MPTLTDLTRLRDAQPQPVPWLWPGRIAAGRLALIDGDPGQGKSLLALDIAARLSRARELPDGHRPSEPAAVLLLSAEDHWDDTILPRLLAAGADLQRVYPWNEGAAGLAVFPEACPQLERLILQTSARLVIIDPFFAFLGRDVGSLNALMIRRALEPLARLTQKTHAALLLIRHLAKGAVGRQALYRGLGSTTIVGAMRTAFVIAPDPPEPQRRVFACTKNNLSAFPPALAFRIGQTKSGVAQVEWLGTIARTADEVLQVRVRRGEAVPQALAFLRQHLAHGPSDRQTLLEEAGRRGISFRSLERAKAALGIVSQQRREEGRNIWYWRLGAG
jgi:hypothetical protein